MMTMKDAIRAQVAALDAGERQFLANHMFKHYQVFPQKLAEHIPAWAVAAPLTLEVGDIVRVKHEDENVNNLPQGMVSIVVNVDREDPNLPYSVAFPQNGSDTAEWARANQLEKVEV